MDIQRCRTCDYNDFEYKHPKAVEIICEKIPNYKILTDHTVVCSFYYGNQDHWDMWEDTSKKLMNLCINPKFVPPPDCPWRLEYLMEQQAQ